MDSEIEGIDEALKMVEDLVIAHATVVATTLTRAYLRDSIQSRRFDTVILDEASMAPIPALWVAASLAGCNAVVVGDFKQLPPIVLSESELAKKWLGRRIDHGFLSDLKKLKQGKELDVCGEQGEYHTVMVDGPLFRKRVQVTYGSIVQRNGYWFLDIPRYRLELK